MKCYICEVSDPNESHFDSSVYGICALCTVKLWELAQEGIEFELRNQTISIDVKDSIEKTEIESEICKQAISLIKDLPEKTSRDLQVVLTSGYEVELAGAIEVLKVIQPTAPAVNAEYIDTATRQSVLSQVAAGEAGNPGNHYSHDGLLEDINP